ncbi:MAG: NADP-dependent isocitrate dehydrogenase, partial [Micrococcaceae bacterium]|nr:NADP-dependent isocitrate dehydrogenase [Micrococcaceae bacterium]
MAKIIYTHTDEAPMLATYSFLPIVEAFASTAGVEFETRDISLAGRIIALFGDFLSEDQRQNDALAELGALARKPEANIIKLPNISASMPQLKAAIAELQSQGYALPDYPNNPASDEETDIRSRYDRIKGSAVNPVLREGNSDRRAPLSVKNYARKYPHSMGAWSADSKTNVATMADGDFRANEKSVVMDSDDRIEIRFIAQDGTVKVLKKAFDVLKGEVIDGTFMSAAQLDAFLADQVARAKKEGVLFSAHLKATMMKISDPIIFGHVVKAFFPDLFATYGEDLEAAGLSPNHGLAAILGGLEDLSEEVRDGVKTAIEDGLANGPGIAMVDSTKGITNLHVPSDVIVDASMPAMIRTSGHMWNKDDAEQD